MPPPFLNVICNNNLIYGLLSFELTATTGSRLPRPQPLLSRGGKDSERFPPGISFKKSLL